MAESELLNRITLDPEVMVGKPVIMGTRITVEHILGLLAQGMPDRDILREYPGLAEDDLRACLLFATRSLENTEFMPLSGRGA